MAESLDSIPESAHLIPESVAGQVSSPTLTRLDSRYLLPRQGKELPMRSVRQAVPRLPNRPSIVNRASAVRSAINSAIRDGALTPTA